MAVKPFERIFGAGLHPAIRPLLAIQVVGSLAGSALFTYMGLWALRRLHATSTALGTAFFLAACGALAAGVIGGVVSDRVGRRPLILLGRGAFAVTALAALPIGSRTSLGLALIVLTTSLISLGDGASQALVADLTGPGQRDAAYAALRVAANIGVVLGPPVGAGLILAGWNALFAGATILAAASCVLAVQRLPRLPPPARQHRDPGTPRLAVLRDRRFGLIMIASSLGWMVYLSFEVLLPISLVQHHHMAPSVWGVVVIVNPIMVTLLQLRVTHWTSRYPATARIAIGLALMGFPFIALSISSAVGVVAVLVGVFVIGEMLLVPATLSAVVTLAPPAQRGAYLGVFAATGSVGFALAPLGGLWVLSRFGDPALWGSVAVLSLVSGGLWALGLRGIEAGSEPA